jgi:type IV pilus assembly protein PilB
MNDPLHFDPDEFSAGAAGDGSAPTRSGSAAVSPPRPEASEAKALANDASLSALYVPETHDHAEREDLAELLHRIGELDAERFATARRLQKQAPGRRFAEVLVGLGLAEAVVQEAAATIAGIPFRRIEGGIPDADLLAKLGTDYCRRHMVLPIGHEGGRVVVGTVSPDDVFLLDDVKRRLGATLVRHVLITAADLQAVLEAAAGDGDEADISRILADVAEDDVEVQQEEEVSDDIERQAESSPVVRYVNLIIQSAVRDGASDIHIEPDERQLRVRFRIDGVLFDAMNPPRRLHAALTSRIKIMANLDIAERRLPQDGRIRAAVGGRQLDIRVSTVPTPAGEKTVMRLLDNRSIQTSLEDLGFEPATLSTWTEQIAQPHGIILVTGPTGSGKTTTLYSSIRKMDIRRMNVSTVEDPVEYHLSGITQIQTHERIGMSFARALKALLRQDPDVVMVGEIRDLETAVTAIQAALTGHLVLSTLHTNDAPGAVTRLINIGVEPFLVGAALNAVLAQRLVRRICPSCRSPFAAGPEMAAVLAKHGIDPAVLQSGKGCEQCRQTGYSGRVGIYELLAMNDRLRDSVAGNPSITEFRRVCLAEGMQSLRHDGFAKVSRGLTTVEEVFRVTDSTL